MWFPFFMLALVAAVLPEAHADALGQCPGYKATNVQQHQYSLTADLILAGDPCNVYSSDLLRLKLLVEYQTEERLHIMIYDPDEAIYQVPKSVLPRPASEGHFDSPNIKFSYEAEPFSFKVLRDQDVLFDTSENNLVFETQYLNLRTWLPEDPNIYGLGEHSDSLRLPSTNYTRTMWNRDAYGIPSNSNLYGTHPIYVDHRGDSGTHGVFFLNSNGMDIKMDKLDDGRQYLEYNTQGGVIDLYFLAGPTPKDVSKQYAEVVGFPAMQSYWTFGFHNCRYGYQDAFDVAEVVYNYSLARIPLETMWTDIDYMDRRRVFTLDPERFPLKSMRELVEHLHKHDMHYIVMVDPAVSNSENDAFNQGSETGIFLTDNAGDLYQGAVWPGPTVWPDWFNPQAQDYWNNQFAQFFSPGNGVDIDGLWIDMNEGANFCPDPCEDPAAYSQEANLPPAPPPVRSPPRPLPGFPGDFQPSADKPPQAKIKRGGSSGNGKKIGLPDRDLLTPKYQIANEAGSLSNKTIRTDLVHAGEGYVEYDTHNLYGTMMSSASREAMLQRRPSVRPLVITRSTFAGAGTHVGHWLGDNLSQWDKYRVSIAEMLAFASIFQIPMVGSDVCGFGGNTTEELCARWATLGAFNPFYRNHNELGSTPQEFYRWPIVAEAARKSINTRYRLLDYLYTAFWQQTQTGEPFLQPLFYIYPNDSRTFGNEMQFFYGDALLISPVHDQGQTSVSAYFPDDIFYDFYTHLPVRGHGANVTLKDIPLTDIPVHIRGGSVIPLRLAGTGAGAAQTTTELRRKNYELVVAPGLDGTARGQLYLDDGESIEPKHTSLITFEYKRGRLYMGGDFGYQATGVIEAITVLGQVHGDKWGRRSNAQFDVDRQSVTVTTRVELTRATEIEIE